jgi:hypothetical protein
MSGPSTVAATGLTEAGTQSNNSSFNTQSELTLNNILF